VIDVLTASTLISIASRTLSIVVKSVLVDPTDVFTASTLTSNVSNFVLVDVTDVLTASTEISIASNTESIVVKTANEALSDTSKFPSVVDIATPDASNNLTYVW